MGFETNFKEPRSAKVDRFNRRMKRNGAEDANKAEVRRRDKYCRFPLCGCRKFGIRVDGRQEVSHNRHKGMGGNPKGERSAPELMIYACHWRHQEARISIHRGTLRWLPVDEDAGSNGPVVWEVDAEALRLNGLSGWLELAREVDVQRWQPFTEWQASILKQLSAMSI